MRPRPLKHCKVDQQLGEKPGQEVVAMAVPAMPVAALAVAGCPTCNAVCYAQAGSGAAWHDTMADGCFAGVMVSETAAVSAAADALGVPAPSADAGMSHMCLLEWLMFMTVHWHRHGLYCNISNSDNVPSEEDNKCDGMQSCSHKADVNPCLLGQQAST